MWIFNHHGRKLSSTFGWQVLIYHNWIVDIIKTVNALPFDWCRIVLLLLSRRRSLLNSLLENLLVLNISPVKIWYIWWSSCHRLLKVIVGVKVVISGRSCGVLDDSTGVLLRRNWIVICNVHWQLLRVDFVHEGTKNRELFATMLHFYFRDALGLSKCRDWELACHWWLV